MSLDSHFSSELNLEMKEHERRSLEKQQLETCTQATCLPDAHNIFNHKKKSVRGIRRTLQEVKCIVTLETEDK